MRAGSFALATTLLCAAFWPAAAGAQAIAGQWRTDDGKAIVTFADCGEALCGRITRFLVPEPAGGARDDENPNKDLRARKLLGLRIFWDLKLVDGVWQGQGYNPEDGRYFRAKIAPEGRKLKVRGCILFICKSKIWAPA